jgi:hypothetical protein
MDRFEDERNVNISEIASATGVNDVMDNSDYDNVNAGGFDKFMKKLSKVADKANAGVSMVKGAADLYKSTKEKPTEPKEDVNPKVVDDSTIVPQTSSKLPLIIGGAVVGLGIIGFVLFKVLGKKK